MSNLTVGILAPSLTPELQARVEVLGSLGWEIILLGVEQAGGLGGKIRAHPYKWEGDFSKARNRLHTLVSTPWVLHLDSDETLDPGSFDLINGVIRGDPCILKVSVLLGESRVFLPRLVVREAVWKRPCNEIPVGGFPIRVEPRVIIRHDEVPTSVKAKRVKEYLSLLEEEYRRTKDPDLLFVSAIQASFVDQAKARLYANTYLTNFPSWGSPKQRFQSLLMDYLLSFLDYQANEIPRAIKRLQGLILREPKYSEFWCLLGDCYRQLGAIYQAREVYENALAIGRYTPILDEGREWFDMEKYGDYPRVMIEFCNKELDKGRVVN